MFAAAFIGLLIVEPDFGQTVLMMLVFSAMLLIYGIPWTVIVGLAGACAGATGDAAAASVALGGVRARPAITSRANVPGS